MSDTPQQIAENIVAEYEQHKGGGPSRYLRGGFLTEEVLLAQELLRLRDALREATAIGIANLFAYYGAYESLSQHKREQWDKLSALAKMADGGTK